MIFLARQVGELSHRWSLHIGRGRDKQVCITEEGLEVDSDLVDVLKVELTVDNAVVGILALAD